MFITTLLLAVFSGLLAVGAVLFAGYGVCQWASGREFEGLALPGDIAQALHAELEARWRATLAR